MVAADAPATALPAPLLGATLDARTVAVARAGLDPHADVHDPAQVHRWERRFAAWLGLADTTAAVRGFGSGRAALLAVLRALDLGPDAEVIVPAFTCRSVTQAIRQAGAVPRFADIETEAFGLDVEATAQALRPSVRALLLQHSFGLPGRDLQALLALAEQHGLRIVEDCAHALGARWHGRPLGTLGDAAVFSFERGKVLSTCHGGMGVVRPAPGAARLNLLADGAPTLQGTALRTLLGSVGRDFHAAGGTPDAALDAALAGGPPTPRMWPEEFEGRPCAAYGLGLSPVVAAMAQAQFDRLDEVLARRRAQAAVWAAWADARGLVHGRAQPGAEPAWLRFPVWVDAALKADPRPLADELGVEVGLWFTTPEHPVPAPQPHAPRGMAACAQVVNLPTLLPPDHPWAPGPSRTAP
jgi:perosamine synthetase